MRKRRPEAGRIWTQDLVVGRPSLKLQCHYWCLSEPYVRVQHIPRTYVWYISCIVCCTQLAISRLSRVSLIESRSSIPDFETSSVFLRAFLEFNWLNFDEVEPLSERKLIPHDLFTEGLQRMKRFELQLLHYAYTTKAVRLHLLDYYYQTTARLCIEGPRDRLLFLFLTILDISRLFRPRLSH